MGSPLVSVLMPAYNSEKYIAEAIESILNQTYKNIELIIVDDASLDSTWHIISEFKRKDSRIVAVRNETNLYIAENRNKAISLANGKYIAWQDSDDVSYSHRIEKQVEFMEANPEVGICGGFLDFYFNNEIVEHRKYFYSDKKLRKTVFRQSPVAQPTAIIRKECIDKVGMFNAEYPPAEDLDMSFRIGTHYKFANLQLPLIKYRVHLKSATSQKFKIIMLTTLKIRFKNIKNKAYRFTLLALGLPPIYVYRTFRRFRNLSTV